MNISVINYAQLHVNNFIGLRFLFRDGVLHRNLLGAILEPLKQIGMLMGGSLKVMINVTIWKPLGEKRRVRLKKRKKTSIISKHLVLK